MQNKIQKLFFFDRTFQIQNTALEFLPYKFTAKELDEETGLYYYGARYLDPRYSRWLSCDPALDEYMSGSDAGCGGAYNSVNLNLYHYAWNNPVKYTDPNGEFIFLAIPVATMAAKAAAWFVGSLAICAVSGYVIGKTAENAVEYAKGNSKPESRPTDKPKDEPSPMPEEGAESGKEGYKTPPKELPGVPDAKPSKPKTPKQGGNSGKRKRWKDSDGNIYEWDYQHGDVEKYDKRGKHKGSIDPNTGEQTKPPVKGRTVEP